jgi:hypothetical protein
MKGRFKIKKEISKIKSVGSCSYDLTMQKEKGEVSRRNITL